MIYRNDKIVENIYVGDKMIKEAYLGDKKVYPGLVSVESKIFVSGWQYNLPSRTRTITPYILYTYQNGTTSAVYSSSTTESEIGTITFDDPNVWNYFENNSYRIKYRTPIITFSDETRFGEVEEIKELADDVSTWSYAGLERSRTQLWRYSDITKTGAFLLERATVSYEYGNWRYDTMPFSRERFVTTSYDWTESDPQEHRETESTQQDYPSNSNFNTVYDYILDIRTTITNYVFSDNSAWTSPPFVESPTIITTFSLEVYENEHCDYYTFELVDYLQVKKQYTWAGTPTLTFSPVFNGQERRRKIDGTCGYVRAWTNWTNNSQFCDESGNLGYSCEGTYSVTYYRQVRYYQYPDGSGRTSTEYRAGELYSRLEVVGQCGYKTRIRIDYQGYSVMDIPDAFYSNLTGSVYQDTNGLYYTSETEADLSAGGYYITSKGSTAESSLYIYIEQ